MGKRVLHILIGLVPGLIGAYLIVLDVKLQFHFVDAVAKFGTAAAAGFSGALGSLGGFGVCLSVFILLRRSKNRGRRWRFVNTLTLIALTMLLLNVALGLIMLYWVVMPGQADIASETSETISAANAEQIRQGADVMGGHVGMLVDKDGY